MAFPVVVGRSADGHASGLVVSFKVDIPAGANGELLLITWAKRNGSNAEYILPTGWTNIGQYRSADNTINWNGIWRIADGTEDITVTLETTTARVQSACIQRISGHDPAIPPAFALIEGLYDIDGEPDPPNNDTGISKDYLWIAAMTGRGANNISAGPTGYSNLQEIFSDNGGAGSGVGTATAEFTSTAQAENPATFTTGRTNNQAWIALTIAIAPDAVVTAVGEFSLEATVDLTFTGFVEPDEGEADQPFGATGETGVWRSGVWVEPQDFEGDFALSSAGELEYTGRFSFAGLMEFVATSVLAFDGAVVEFGEFDTDAASDLIFTGTFTNLPGVGTFALTGTASADFAWVPKFDFPGSEVGIPDDPADVIIKTKPGDVIVIGGVTGVVIIDELGRLVVVDHAGEVLCILGPSGVEL